MEKFKVLVRLYDMTNPAVDGSIINRQVTEAYLASKDYDLIIKDKLAMGGGTHKDRVVESKYEDVIGPDDQIIINNNCLFYISKIYTKPDSNFCYAEITFFDEDNFSGPLKDKLINLKGLLKSGVNLPCSVVIQAIWSSDNRCERIIRIKGVDFTLNPAFKGAGTEKLMSVNVKNIDTISRENRLYSDLNVTSNSNIITKVFSFNSVIESNVDNGIKLLAQRIKESKLNAIKFYGRNSKESLISNNFSETNEEKLEMTKSIIDSNEGYLNSFDKFIELLGDVDLGGTDYLNQIFNSNKSQLSLLVSGIPITEPNYKELIRPYIIQYFKNLPNKSFSTTENTLLDRLRLLSYPRYIQLKKIINTYKSIYFIKSNIFTEDSDQTVNLAKLFIQDVIILLKNSSDDIVNGSTLTSLYQLSTLDKELSEFGINVSRSYRRLLLSLNILGFVPKNIMSNWLIEFDNFMNRLSVITFNKDIVTKYIENIDRI